MLHRREKQLDPDGPAAATEATTPPHRQDPPSRYTLPHFRRNGKPVSFGIRSDGESGRRGIHPLHFLRVLFRSSNTVSMLVNFLWPVVPVAIAVHFALPDHHLLIFILNYIAMIPAANTIGFAGQELARKLPKVFGVLLETTFGSVVEIILFVILIVTGNPEEHVPIIKAAILGSILANLLLCLGLCFFVGGLRRTEQTFNEVVSETGSGLMLVAGSTLVIPGLFLGTLQSRFESEAELIDKSLKISRAVSILLILAFAVYVYFQMRTHHSLYDDLYEAEERIDEDRLRDQRKAKLTMTESIVALMIALACVSLIALFLVQQISFVVEERHISDAFVGLILVPLVEKMAEHLTAIDEAFDNQANFALSHVIGASIQTALLNTPIVVFVGWALNRHMDLTFEVFDAAVLILAILVVGNFLRDGKSNYLEGFLCVLVYVAIAVSAWYYPNPHKGVTTSGEGNAGQSETGHKAFFSVNPHKTP